jgi:hypothetical protein
MAHTIIGKSPHSITLDEWYKQNDDQNVEYTLREEQPNAIAFHTGGLGSEEMIRVDKDGFYIRGVRVPADEHEAETVYNAFKQWLAWANLQRR